MRRWNWFEKMGQISHLVSKWQTGPQLSWAECLFQILCSSSMCTSWKEPLKPSSLWGALLVSGLPPEASLQALGHFCTTLSPLPSLGPNENSKAAATRQKQPSLPHPPPKTKKTPSHFNANMPSGFLSGLQSTTCLFTYFYFQPYALCPSSSKQYLAD